MSSDSEDLKGKFSGEESEEFSNEAKVKESASAQNSKKKEEENKKKISEKKEDKKPEIQPKKSKEKEESSDDDSSEKEKNKKKKNNSDSSDDDDDKSKKLSKKDKKEKEREKEIEREKDKKLAAKMDSDNEEINEKNKEVKNEDKNEKKVKEEKENKEDKEDKNEKIDKKEDKNEDKKEAEKKEDKKDEKKEDIKKEDNEKKEKEKKDKEEKKDEKKDKKKEKTETKRNSSSSSSSSKSSDSEKNKTEKEKENKKKKEDDEKKKREDEEKRKKDEEKKRKQDEEKKNSENKKNESNDNRNNNIFNRGGYQGSYNNRERDNYNNSERFGSGFSGSGNRYGDSGRYGGNDGFNRNNRDDQGSYQQRKPKKYDLNEVKTLNKIIAEYNVIINEMKNSFPGITQLECASVFKKIKQGSSQTIFEIMNQIHREISIQITLNEADNKNKNYLLPIDPYEIIDPFYNNPEHIKVMKYYHVYKESDKKKLPPFIQSILKPDFIYTNESNRRRKVVKYPEGSFNYIPIRCENRACKNEECIYSHTDIEMSFHPLFYKTKYNSNNKGLLEKTASDLLEDFRIIYNYKNPNIINLIKLLEEQKIAKTTYRDYYKNKINSFKLETFKTIECPSVKSGITCQKDSHLCYFYHNNAERRRPPTLYRYTNELCPDQTYKDNGRIRNKCKNEDFCNKCHSRYEYYYHKLFFGKAMTCLRPKKKGRCIFEETCYAYHPYKEPGYKKTKEEKIQEKKDEIMDKLNEEYELLNGLINQYKCQSCGKFNKKFIYYLLVKCNHIICCKCFKENDKKKCPKCKTKLDLDSKEECIEMDIKTSSKNIDEIIKKHYEEKTAKKKNENGKKEEHVENETFKGDDTNEKKDVKNNEKDNEKSDDDGNNSMG